MMKESGKGWSAQEKVDLYRNPGSYENLLRWIEDHDAMGERHASEMHDATITPQVRGSLSPASATSRRGQLLHAA